MKAIIKELIYFFIIISIVSVAVGYFYYKAYLFDSYYEQRAVVK